MASSSRPPPDAPVAARPLRIHRRAMLARLAALGAGGGVLLRFLSPAESAGRVLVRAPRGDVPRNGALVFDTERVAIVDRDGTQAALSLVCTHLGCTVDVGTDRIRCHCHGSEFDHQGRVLRGPARRPLERLRLRDAGGDVEVSR